MDEELPEDNSVKNSDPQLDIRELYDSFDTPVTDFDCGLKCAPHNPHHIPVCCDICEAVPVAFHQEWTFMQPRTDLWHEWRGDECTQEPVEPAGLRTQTPQHMRLLACKGPTHCQRQYRAVSCRQFPFFPYITSDDRFIGLAYEWEFEKSCWVISNLSAVSVAYRREFVQIYDVLLSIWYAEYLSYADLSEDMRLNFSANKRRIPLLHRNGGYYLISPASERMQRVLPEHLPRFGPYRSKKHL